MDFTPNKPVSYPFGSTQANARVGQLRDRADYKGLESRGAGFFTGPSKLPSASKSAGSTKPSATSLAARKHDAAQEFIRGVEEQRNFERKYPKVVGWGKDYNDSLIRDMRQGVEKEVGASSSLAARKSTETITAQDFIERAKEQWDLFNKEKGADRRSNDRFNSALRSYPYRNDRFNSALRPNPRVSRKDDQRDPRKDWSFDWFRRVALR